jgi:hypothetical protein
MLWDVRGDEVGGLGYQVHRPRVVRARTNPSTVSRGAVTCPTHRGSRMSPPLSRDTDTDDPHPNRADRTIGCTTREQRSRDKPVVP